MSAPRFTVRDAKLDRLFRCSRLTSQDEFRANYIYEQRSHRNFAQAALNAGLWGGVYALFFRGQKKILVAPALCGMFLLTFTLTKGRNNRVLDECLDPLFEKYKIK